MSRALLSPLRLALNSPKQSDVSSFLSLSVRGFHASTSAGQKIDVVLQEQIDHAFKADPAAAAAAIGKLPKEHSYRMLNALVAAQAQPGSPRYINKLFDQSDANKDGLLDPSELEEALKRHLLLSKDTRVEPATARQLAQVALASSLPFLGFGTLDNGIMILAGDYIDETLGAAFCLSTMAAAGLGNLASDVVGIFCAEWIEKRAQLFRFGRLPDLSPFQKRSAGVTWARTAGAVVGISIGCLIGMIPLLFRAHKHAG